MIGFLDLRLGFTRRPISQLLGIPAAKEGGWFRCEWLPFQETPLAENSLVSGGGPADWHRAWHGCKIEALYSVMCEGRLRASCNTNLGHRFFEGAPGVYLHKDENREKAWGSYSSFIPLFGDGVFWCSMWEVRADRTDKCSHKGTDQWINPERSTRLSAL